MKYLLIVFLVIFCSPSIAHTQNNIASNPDSLMFVSRSEKQPKWNDGTNQELMASLYNKINYPIAGCKEGLMVLQITIDTSGAIRNSVIKRSLSKTIDDQLLQAIMDYKFIPSEVNGKKSDCLMNFPFRIKCE